MIKLPKICFIIIALALLINPSCLSDIGPVYVNLCPCDITPFKDCDCDPDTLIEILFKEDIIPFLDKYCVSCHGDSCQYVNFKPGKAYENVMRYTNTENPVRSVIYQSIIMEFMPPLGEYTKDSVLITEELIPSVNEQRMLLNWIEQGALNN